MSSTNHISHACCRCAKDADSRRSRLGSRTRVRNPVSSLGASKKKILSTMILFEAGKESTLYLSEHLKGEDLSVCLAKCRAVASADMCVSSDVYGPLGSVGVYSWCLNHPIGCACPSNMEDSLSQLFAPVLLIWACLPISHSPSQHLRS